jgi:hypothetical protein
MLIHTERERLIRLLKMGTSSHIGERAGAILLANRIITSAGLDWHDVIQPAHVPYVPPPPTNDELQRHRKAERDRVADRSWARGLSDAELDVILACAATDEPTEAQTAALKRILAKIRHLANGRPEG